ncbi:hypothetical protein B0H19DRAFT_1236259 [Mycena capillaripes]|nr:hypothetical protein B0H19DRAFT_1236259 [Mycena capillaripes]
MSQRMALRSVAPRVNHCALVSCWAKKLDNDAGSDTCDWSPDDVCHGSTRKQCMCSGISYIVWAACDACPPDPIDTRWRPSSASMLPLTRIGAGTIIVTLKISDVPAFLSNFRFHIPSYATLLAGADAFPSWAFAMIAATPTISGLKTTQPTTFDMAAASAFALSPSIPNSTPDPAPSASTTEQSSTSSISQPPPTTPPITPTSLSTTKSSIILSSSVPSSGKHISESQSTSATSSSPISVSNESSVISGTPSSTASSQPVGLASRNSLATGAIVGIVLGIFSLILLFALLVWVRRRRRQTAYPATPFYITSSGSDTSVPSNLTSDDSDARSASSAQGQPLQPEWHIPREKMMHSEYAANRNLILSTHSASNTASSAPNPDVMSQLRDVRARVLELEAQLESPRAGRSYTPPPGYSGEER